MGQTLTNLITHIIFSTKSRRPMINNEIKPELMAYLGGLVRQLNGHPLKINGMDDHVHILAQLPPTVSISEALRIIKANSSKWINQKWHLPGGFSWQTGYGAFSVSRSALPAVIRYIEDQEKHHQQRSFQEEFLLFIKRHGLEYDDRYIWD